MHEKEEKVDVVFPVEKVVNNSYFDGLKTKLKKLFLHCVFHDPELIRGEIIKHLEIPSESIGLQCERTVGNSDSEEQYKIYTLLLFGSEFMLHFKRRIEQPREINIPKVVLQPKKWYQARAKKIVVIEKKRTSDRPLVNWILSSVE
jgi:hypothetical protein